MHTAQRRGATSPRRCTARRLPCVRSPRRLTPAEVLDLRETGPFTRYPYTVKLLLDPATVKLTIKEIFNESMSFVKQAMRRSGIRDPRDLTVSKIAR